MIGRNEADFEGGWWRVEGGLVRQSVTHDECTRATQVRKENRLTGRELGRGRGFL